MKLEILVYLKIREHLERACSTAIGTRDLRPQILLLAGEQVTKQMETGRLKLSKLRRGH